MISPHGDKFTSATAVQHLLPICIHVEAINKARRHVAQRHALKWLQVIVFERSVLSFYAIVRVHHYGDVREMCQNPSLSQQYAEVVRVMLFVQCIHNV